MAHKSHPLFIIRLLICCELAQHRYSPRERRQIIGSFESLVNVLCFFIIFYFIIIFIPNSILLSRKSTEKKKCQISNVFVFHYMPSSASTRCQTDLLIQKCETENRTLTRSKRVDDNRIIPFMGQSKSNESKIEKETKK